LSIAEPAFSSIASDLLPAFWVNGQRQSSNGPHISARDRGLTLADGVFETMRVRAGVVFRLDRHLARLHDALTVLDIPIRPELPTWVLDAVGVVGRNDASVRLTVTRGIGTGPVAPTPGATPTVIVAVNPLPVFPSSIYEVGLSMHVASGLGTSMR
jgi:branched-chain amino acid aminotransferase